MNIYKVEFNKNIFAIENIKHYKKIDYINDISRYHLYDIYLWIDIDNSYLWIDIDNMNRKYDKFSIFIHNLKEYLKINIRNKALEQILITNRKY